MDAVFTQMFEYKNFGNFPFGFSESGNSTTQRTALCGPFLFSFLFPFFSLYKKYKTLVYL